MIGGHELLAAIYAPLLLLGVITLWRMWGAYKLTRVEGRSRAARLLEGVLMIIFVLMIETIYYGIGRFLPGQYALMYDNAVAVGLIKCGYVAAFLLWTRAYWEISGEPPRWLCATVLGAGVFVAALVLVVK